MKCKFEHDGDCCNCGATQYMCKCKSPCDTIVPITNADRIRAMSDEKLAKMFMEFSEKLLNECGVVAEAKTTEYVLEWLKQPAEVK